MFSLLWIEKHMSISPRRLQQEVTQRALLFHRCIVGQHGQQGLLLIWFPCFVENKKMMGTNLAVIAPAQLWTVSIDYPLNVGECSYSVLNAGLVFYIFIYLFLFLLPQTTFFVPHFFYTISTKCWDRRITSLQQSVKPESLKGYIHERVRICNLFWKKHGTQSESD